MRRVGSDAGGTFTDLVLDDGSMMKVPSTPDDPGAAVREGIEGLVDTLAGGLVLTHGTTVATNALLERRGARVALVTNQGFGDVIEIARQDRPSLYDQTIDRPIPLVPRQWRYEVRGRLDARGVEIEPLDIATLPEIDPTVDAVAVCLLHSDLNPTHEIAVRQELERRGIDVTISSEIAPEFREYERTVTTAINAYLRPVCRAYLQALDEFGDDVLVMTSAGGLTSAVTAAEYPATLLLSGPAGGVLAGAAIAAANGFPNAITFDMGGTSTDVCLVLGGHPEPAAQREVSGFPVRLPALDIHTIGAGGGSIAFIDDGGALQVGPQSAGARPGPACYGHGGVRATVTDANLVAGRLPADVAFAGLGDLDLDAATSALAAAGLSPTGVLAVVNATMEQALRVVSVERGVDPRGLALVAFGGAGPLHACELAAALGMNVVVVPPRAGVFSAVGIMCAPRQHDLVASWPEPTDHTGVGAALDRLGQLAAAQVWPRPNADDGQPSADGRAVAERPVRLQSFVDCRYVGQSHELRVPWSPNYVDAFHASHERQNGYARPESPIEIVALRVNATVDAPLVITDLPSPERQELIGPGIIAESDCTIWIPAGWQAERGSAGALLLHLVAGPAGTADAVEPDLHAHDCG